MGSSGGVCLCAGIIGEFTELSLRLGSLNIRRTVPYSILILYSRRYSKKGEADYRYGI